MVQHNVIYSRCTEINMKVVCCKRSRLLFLVLYLTQIIPDVLLSTAIRWYRDYWSGREELLSASALSTTDRTLNLQP
jgi:hypothetical protein